MAEIVTRQQALAELTAPGAAYELQTVAVGTRTLRCFTGAPVTLRALYEGTASAQPFVVYGDQRFTFAEAWLQAGAIGALLRSRGVQRGDRVAIAMRNLPEWMLAFMAITSLGAVAVAMNALWSLEEAAHALKDCDATLLLADPERVALLAGLAPTIGVRCAAGTPGVERLVDLLPAHAGAAMPAADIQPDDGAAMLYTSGSTGHAKGVLLTHRNLCQALLGWEVEAKARERVLGITPPADPPAAGVLLAVPLFHATGLIPTYLASYRTQRKLVAMHKWDPELGAQLVQRERLTSVVGTPAITGDLVRVARQGRHDLSSLLSVGGGGASRAPEQVRQIDQVFPNALPGTGWGMTETSALGTVIGGEDYLAHPDSSGRCAVLLDLRVVDELGRTLGPNERGELQVRGTTVFTGYWKRPDADAQAFVDGWFRTGDVATIDDDGFVVIVDRIKDLIIRGGENIGCGQVENALLMHPQVIEAVAYAVPDDRLGEEVGCTLHTEADIDPDALRDFLAQHLARFEIPRHIVQTRQPLPRTPSGKLFKRQIRAQALEMLKLQ
jgi:long-chain acyl-CoA synthetase